MQYSNLWKIPKTQSITKIFAKYYQPAFIAHPEENYKWSLAFMDTLFNLTFSKETFVHMINMIKKYRSINMV